ncbi:MAG: hypothetical protein V3V35_10755, partial [Dehalococcoidia bacterium]
MATGADCLTTIALASAVINVGPSIEATGNGHNDAASAFVLCATMPPKQSNGPPTPRPGGGKAMDYQLISADDHMDLNYLP